MKAELMRAELLGRQTPSAIKNPNASSAISTDGPNMNQKRKRASSRRTNPFKYWRARDDEIWALDMRHHIQEFRDRVHIVYLLR